MPEQTGISSFNLAALLLFDILRLMNEFKLPSKKQAKNFMAAPLILALIIFSFLLIIDLFLTIPMNPQLRGLLIGGCLGGLIAGGLVFKQSYKRITRLESKESSLLSTLEESLETLQNVVDGGHFESGALADLDEENVLVLHDCAVFAGAAQSESYVIPYVSESDGSPESQALFSALNVMKENNVRFKVLKTKHGNALLKRSSKTEWLSDGSNFNLNFPQNFVNLN